MAAMLRISLGLTLLGLLVIAHVIPQANASLLLGGKSDVTNVQNDVQIQELGRFCVDKINLEKQRQQGNSAEFVPLTLLGVVSAQKQVVAGTKYYLRISATKPDGSNRMFDTVVVIQPWLHHKKFLGYTPVAIPTNN